MTYKTHSFTVEKRETSDDPMTASFKQSVKIAIATDKARNIPIAKYDTEKKAAYLEYSDGRREY